MPQNISDNSDFSAESAEANAAEGEAGDCRLPRVVVPVHYEIELAPDLEAAEFTGSVAVDVDIVEAVDSIVCNAADLQIEEARLITGSVGAAEGARLTTGSVGAATGEAGEAEAPAGEALAAAVDPDSERLTLTPAGGSEGFEPGRARLLISFSGVLNEQLRGFYLSTFTGDDGAVRTIAVTQFEATDARRAFPCWDEPSFKATFAVSLVVEDGLTAISNGAEVGREPVGQGQTRVSFATTMPMSTYLVACVVGPLETTGPVDAGGVPVRVVHRPGRGAQAAFALEVAEHALDWFRDYYDLDYPSDKLDLVAIPDFEFGAMENLGCVTFREVLLLIDTDTATQAETQRVTTVISHELAHMWFGDLVTMAWWDGLWLNEAFAAFMETACTDAFRPEWKAWSSFGRSRSHALFVDSLGSTRPIEHPVATADEAEDMFDVLTYQKGASLVRMLEQYLGAEQFKAGVRLYLKRHAHGNTRNADLWNALEDATGQPVRAIMESWIGRGGHPVVRARVGDHGVTLSQRHFTLDPDLSDDRLWHVPVRLRTRGERQREGGDAPGGSTADESASPGREDGGAGTAPPPDESEHRLLLDGPRRTLTVQPGSVVTANAGASGFFRFDPGPDAVAAIAAAGAAGWSDSAEERHSLVEDVRALALSGDLDVAVLLDFLLDGFTAEHDLNVWQALADALGHIRRLLYGRAARRFGELVVDTTGEISDYLGLEPRAADDDRLRELRSLVLRLRGAVADHSPTVEACRARLDHSDPALAAAALTVTARHGGADDFDRIRRRFENAPDPQSEQRHLAALADFRSPDLVLSILEGALDGRVRTQDAPYLLCRALTNPDAGEQAWTFATGRWDELMAVFPGHTVARMLEGVTVLDRPESAADVQRFISDHPLPHSAKQIAQLLERLAVNAAFRGRAAPLLTEAVLDR